MRSVMLLSMLLAPVGAPAVLTAAFSADACESACPCEREASEAGETTEQTVCADDCAQCTCCVSAFIALSPDPGLLCPSHPEGDARRGLQDDPARGVSPRVFRPPQSAPV
jgi:hypothetical protein